MAPSQHRARIAQTVPVLFLQLIVYALPAIAVAASDPLAQEPEERAEREAEQGRESTHVELPDMEVTTEAEPFGRFVVDGDAINPAGPGAGDVLSWAPGADVNANGVLTPIPQYRGLFGNRLNVTVDGVITTSACPNEMEPPLHYLPLPRFEALEMERGIASVSSGLETLGTSLQASTRSIEFGDARRYRFTGEVSAFLRSVDDGYSVGGLLGASNRSHRFQVGFSEDEGDDFEFAGGTVASSRYERQAAELGYGYRGAGQELDAAWLRNETGDTGTPALPMDIRYVDSDILRVAHSLELGERRLAWRASYQTVDHLMDNYSLRPPMNPAMRRFSLADSGSTAWAVGYSLPLAGGELELGTDGHLADNTADILSPDNGMFFVNNFNDSRRDRYGVYAEWRVPATGGWGGELGVRLNQVRMDTGLVDATPARRPGGVRVLRDRFNAADRSQRDHNVDLVAIARRRPDRGPTLELGFARKTRSPSQQERYLWLPLESTAGLADGKRYVGDIGLRPEVSYQFELGMDWAGARYQFSPRAFYRRVEDYIQGIPATDPVVIAVSTASGDPNPLVFANVEAALWGVDMPWGVRLGEHWRLDGVISYVRGERRDIDDDLFRIAPLNGRLALHYVSPSWDLSLESLLYAAQDRVSRTNEETPSSGYGILNLRGNYRFPWLRGREVRLQLDLNNLLDRDYRPHLNGINRVRGSDVALGERLPGPGRSLVAQILVPW